MYKRQELVFESSARLTGIITSATAKHVDEKGRDNNLFTQEQYYYLGHVKNLPYFNGVNPVSVTLNGSAAWTVTGECLLNELILGKNALLTAPVGKQLTMTIDNTVITPIPGESYTGSIRLTIH